MMRDVLGWVVFLASGFGAGWMAARGARRALTAPVTLPLWFVAVLCLALIVAGLLLVRRR